MQNKISYTFLFGAICYLLISFVSCQTSEKTQKDLLWDKTDRFFKTLSFTNYDSTLQVIEDSIKTPEQQLFLYIMMYNHLPYLLPPEQFLRYYAYIEKEIPSDNTDLKGLTKLHRGKAYLEMGRTDSTFNLMTDGLNLMKQGVDSQMIVHSFFTIGNLYLLQGYSLSATRTCLEGMNYLPKQKDSRQQKNLLRNVLSSCYRKHKNYKTGKALAKEIYADALQSKDTTNQIGTLITLGISYAALGQKDSAIWAGTVAEKCYLTQPKHFDNPNNLFGFVWLWRECGLPEKIEPILKALEKQISKEEDKALFSKLLYARGNYHLQKGEFEKAESYYQQLLADKQLPRNSRQFKQLNDSLVVLSLKKNRQTTELSHFYQAKRLNDSLEIVESGQIWADMNVRYETEKKEKALIEVTNQKQSFQIQALIVTLLLVMGSFVSIWVLYRNQQQRIFLAKQNELLAINSSLQEKEIQLHQQQLTDFTANLLAKNKLIEKMEQQMQELMHQANGITNEAYQENKEKLNSLKILGEKDWNAYLDFFEKVHPNLIQRATEELNLTQSEIRIFLLLRQSLSKEEITNALGISAEGTRKSIYRLRKKFNLQDEKELDMFIQSF